MWPRSVRTNMHNDLKWLFKEEKRRYGFAVKSSKYKYFRRMLKKEKEDETSSWQSMRIRRSNQWPSFSSKRLFNYLRRLSGKSADDVYGHLRKTLWHNPYFKSNKNLQASVKEIFNTPIYVVDGKLLYLRRGYCFSPISHDDVFVDQNGVLFHGSEKPSKTPKSYSPTIPRGAEQAFYFYNGILSRFMGMPGVWIPPKEDPYCDIFALVKRNGIWYFEQHGYNFNQKEMSFQLCTKDLRKYHLENDHENRP